MNPDVYSNASYYDASSPSLSDMGDTIGSLGSQLLMGLAGVSMVLLVVLLICFAILILSKMFIFKKLGISMWKALIPIYGMVCLSKRLYGSVGWGVFASVGKIIPGVNLLAYVALFHLYYGIYSEGFNSDIPDLWAVFYMFIPVLCAPITAFSSKFVADDASYIDDEEDDEVSDDKDIDEDEEVEDDESVVDESDEEDDEDEVSAPVVKTSTPKKKSSKVDQLMSVVIYEDGHKVDFEDDDEKRDFIEEVLASEDYKVQLKRDDNGRIMKANFKYIGED